MSAPYPVTPAYYCAEPWLETAPPPHPALHVLGALVRSIDADDLATVEKDLGAFFTDDLVVIGSDGVEVNGKEAGYAKMAAVKYDFSTEMKHQPGAMVIVPDGEGGYDFFGSIIGFIDLKPEFKSHAGRHVDVEGRTWDIAIPTAFRVRFRGLEPGEIRIARHETFADKSVLKDLMDTNS